MCDHVRIVNAIRLQAIDFHQTYCGSGFPVVTSAPVITPSKDCARPVLSKDSPTFAGGADDPTASKNPASFSESISSTAPSLGYTSLKSLSQIEPTLKMSAERVLEHSVQVENHGWFRRVGFTHFSNPAGIPSIFAQQLRKSHPRASSYRLCAASISLTSRAFS
jgi:hypothetical protein